MPVTKDYLADEEFYHKKHNKEGKKTRKEIQNKDRSKYKHTDRREKEVPESITKLPKGRVLSITSEGITVFYEGDKFICNLRGALKKEKTKEKNLVTIGDFVRFTPLAENQGAIEFVEPRTSHLARVDNLSRRKSQLIAANIDQVFIVASATSPTLKPTLIDRYIIAAQTGNMDPIIVINKIDLIDDALDEEKNLFELFKEDYKDLPYPVFYVSAATGEGIEDLKKQMEGKSTVLSGQSGVGKSSLINTLLGSDLEVGDIVERTQKGSHTTSTASLLPLSKGGFCIDTPGIKSFGLFNVETDEIESFFPEIQSVAENCRFNRCTHTHEPDCAVQDAVDEGTLSILRYHSYVSLLDFKETKEEWQ